jgi:large subunit ribosomal protein L31e
VLAKMAGPKKAQYAALAKVARKGVTRRALRRATTEQRKPDNVAYECTIHLAKYLRGRTFNNRAPTAVKKIREFAQTLMRTKDNRIEADLNTAIWKRGVKGVPGRVRVRIQRKVGDTSNEAKPGQRQRKHLYSVISLAKNTDTKGKLTEKVLAKPGQQ